MANRKTILAMVAAPVVLSGAILLSEAAVGKDVPTESKLAKLSGDMKAPYAMRSIVSLDPAAVINGQRAELRDTSEFTIASGLGADIQEVRIYTSADEKFEVGFTKIDTVTLNFHNWPIDEFVTVVEGQVEISSPDMEAKIYGPGDSFVIPKGFNGLWRQLSPVTLLTIFYATDSSGH